MKILKKLKAKTGKKINNVTKDKHQTSIEKIGAEQFRRLVDKGLHLPVAML